MCNGGSYREARGIQLWGAGPLARSLAVTTLRAAIRSCQDQAKLEASLARLIDEARRRRRPPPV
jgi:hypothetical protein